MRLTSDLFKDNERLQRCLNSPADHVVPGSRGPHVGLIQEAMIKLGVGVISPQEVASMSYETSTTRAVLKYKGPPRNIINWKYQQSPDNIVGQMTIAHLDDEVGKLEKKLKETPASVLVSVTKDGAPHDHSKCPELEAGGHEGTPLNPQGFGRKLNIFGDHETDYLGFLDVATDPDYADGRPITFDRPGQRGLPEACASDICMRSVPVTDESFTRQTGKPNTIAEIKRLAMSGCRLTYAGSAENIKTFGPRILRLGVLMETVVIAQPGYVTPLGNVVLPSTFTVYVLTLL